MDYINLILTIILVVLGYCTLVQGSCKNSYDCFTKFVEKYKILFIVASVLVVLINLKMGAKSSYDQNSSDE